jgi:hypothetical protein
MLGGENSTKYITEQITGRNPRSDLFRTNFEWCEHMELPASTFLLLNPMRKCATRSGPEEAQASESKQRAKFRLTLSMADRSRPRTQREELARSISSVKRAQQRQAKHLREVEARAAHRAQELQSGATATTVTRSVRKHIDQSTHQLQSVLESTRQT